MAEYAEVEFKNLILERLRGDATLTGLCPYIWPNEHLGGEMPYVRWGPDQILEDGADCVAGLQYAFQLHVFARKNTDPQCMRIASRIRKVLHGLEAIIGATEAESYGLVSVEHQQTRRATDEDTTVDHAVVEFIGLIDET